MDFLEKSSTTPAPDSVTHDSVTLESYKNPTLCHNHIESRIFENKYFCAMIETPTQIVWHNLWCFDWMFNLTGAKKVFDQTRIFIAKKFWFFKMEPSSKTVENISFDDVKKGMTDALESSLDLLESVQKNFYQGMD